MAIDDFRTHRARVRTCARLNLQAAPAVMSDIARVRARGFAAEPEFVQQYACAPEGFRTSTRAHARPEFREQYAHARARGKI